MNQLPVLSTKVNGMTKNLIFILIILIFCGICFLIFDSGNPPIPKQLYAQTDNLNQAGKDSSVVNDTISINTGRHPFVYENKAFNLGERLIFKIRYGFIKAGTAEMKVLSIEERNDQKLYHIQTTARSSSGFDWVYKVRDEINVFIDYDRLYPLRFEKKLREGGYKADLFIDYNHHDSSAIIEFIRYKKNMDIRKRKRNTIKIPPYVNDILSAFYLIRNQDLQVGKSIYLTTNEKDKVYDLEIQVSKKEILDVEAGKFRCIKIEPLLQGEGIFKRKGRLKVWLSDDQYKIPVQMTSEILVGNITTELTDIMGIKNLPSQIK